MLADGVPEEAILSEYPGLEPDKIRAALAYAARVLADEEVFHFALPA